MAKARSRAFKSLRTKALSYPETREDFPWGESAIKVRGKTFLFMNESKEGLSLSVKLPRSREFALEYPFTRSTGYGLGASGWVSSKFTPREAPPIDVLEAWLHESYCAIAPKKLADKVSSGPGASPKAAAVKSVKKSTKKRTKSSRRPRRAMAKS